MRGDAVTIVMGLAANDAIYMLADSRITWTNERDEVSNTRDVCQKLFQAKVGWCLLGWAGHLCLGRDLVRATFNRLNATDPLHPDWLRSDDAIRKLIRDCRALHAEGRPNHKACRQQAVQLMIGWMDYGRNPFTQSTELLSISSPSMAIQRTEFGVDIIGSGDKILDRMRFESFIEIISRYQEESAGDIKRAFYAAGEAAKHLRQTRVLTVGGLFQIAVLSSKGSHNFWITFSYCHLGKQG